jgi:hypothetical protein
MARKKTPTPTKVEPYDAKLHGEFLKNCKWVATDSAGRKFGGATEAEARKMCEEYNANARSAVHTPA